MSIEKIIVLEDDLIIRKHLEQQLRNRRYDVAAASTIAAAQELLSKDTFDLIFVDVSLPDGLGTDLLKELQTRPVRPLAVVVTGNSSVQMAVDCMKAGAFDYLIKPFSSDQIDVILKKAEDFNQILKVNQFLSHDDDADSGYELIGQSKSMERLRGLIQRVAPTQATVLIQGESGTGKELVARALFRQSPRAGAPFIKMNCAAVPENLIESEFFGHEKGAFTGAMNKREGRFELAHGGTILLDEISEVSLQVQAKLLRVLQEREFERVGGGRTIKVDVRVLATTNRRLEESVEKKEFRQDLYFRLNVVPIPVPALRDRLEDVPVLAQQFMHRFSRKHGVRVKGISDDGIEALITHSWPGNVRELQNRVECAVILSDAGGMIGRDHFNLGPGATPAELSSFDPASAIVALPNGYAAGAPSFSDADQAVVPLAELEKQAILHAINHTKGNRTHAAKLLGISIRTLRNKLNEYGVASRDDTESAVAEEPVVGSAVPASGG